MRAETSPHSPQSPHLNPAAAVNYVLCPADPVAYSCPTISFILGKRGFQPVWWTAFHNIAWQKFLHAILPCKSPHSRLRIKSVPLRGTSDGPKPPQRRGSSKRTPGHLHSHAPNPCPQPCYIVSNSSGYVVNPSLPSAHEAKC